MPLITRDFLFECALEYLKKLVTIPSPSGDETEIACYLAGELESFGLSVNLQPVGKRFNVVARTPATQDHADLLLTGHIDTVPVMDGWASDPFSASITGDRLYGLGAADQKAGIAAQLAALRALSLTGDLNSKNILVVFTPDEEALSDGMLEFLATKPRANLALLSEPHFRPASIGWPGKALVKVTVHGKAAHGGRPWQGVNAIEEGARFLVALGAVEAPEHHHLGKHPFVTLSMKGGYERYSLTVPDRCEITISKQLVPGESKESVRQLVNEAAAAVKQARIEASFARPYYPPAEVSPDHPQVERFRRLFLRVTAETLQLGYGKGVCDGNYLVEAGIPTIAFGPSGGNTHQPNEWVSLRELEVAAEVYYRMCLEG